MKPWELGDDSVFREPSKSEINEIKQKDFNNKQKYFVKLIGDNLASYACVLIVILLIGFIWTDIGISLSWTEFLVDSLISVVLFIVAEYLTSKLGTNGGRLDNTYIKIHKEFLALRQTVIDAGISLMERFCESQIDVEYESYIRKKCKAYKIDYNEYVEKYSKMTLTELQKLFNKSGALAIVTLNQTARIELTPDMLLTDGKVRGERGGIPVSGEEYIEKHTTGVLHILLTAITGVLAAMPSFAFTDDFSPGRVIFTIFKLSMLLFRMYSGYSRGARAFNTVEPRHLQVKIKYLNLYLEFLDETKKEK